jgi:hypothetical protein
MPSSGMLGRVALVRTDVSEEPSATITRTTRIGELGATLAATNNRHTLRRNIKHYSTATKYFLVFLRSVARLLVTANVVPSSPILVTLMMDALRSSEILALRRATRHNIPEDGILQNLERLLLSQLGVCRVTRSFWLIHVPFRLHRRGLTL